MKFTMEMAFSPGINSWLGSSGRNALDGTIKNAQKNQEILNDYAWEEWQHQIEAAKSGNFHAQKMANFAPNSAWKARQRLSEIQSPDMMKKSQILQKAKKNIRSDMEIVYNNAAQALDKLNYEFHKNWGYWNGAMSGVCIGSCHTDTSAGAYEEVLLAIARKMYDPTMYINACFKQDFGVVKENADKIREERVKKWMDRAEFAAGFFYPPSILLFTVGKLVYALDQGHWNDIAAIAVEGSLGKVLPLTGVGKLVNTASDRAVTSAREGAENIFGNNVVSDVLGNAAEKTLGELTGQPAKLAGKGASNMFTPKRNPAAEAQMIKRIEDAFKNRWNHELKGKAEFQDFKNY